MADNYTITLRNAKILGGAFRNFGGEVRKPYNKTGQRIFAATISDPNLANELKESGWNVGCLEPQAGYDGEPTYFVNVKFAFKSDNPRIKHNPVIYQFSGATKDSEGHTRYLHRTLLDEDTVEDLNDATIDNATVVINGNPWTDEETGQTRYSAWLRSLKVAISDGYDEDDEDFMMAEDSEEMPFN